MRNISNRFTNITAAILLILMFCMTFFSQLGDSATMDELAHIPAGYSYLSQQDFRINPEHPPLIKDISAIPLMFLDLNFPIDHPSWTEEINGQWWLGNEFIYQSGNDADEIIFWARIPMILLLILLGLMIFKFAKDFFGNKVALLTLTIFSFSPSFLAHGSLVTTDIGATLGLVLATYFWLKFLKSPVKKNIILAGIAFGIAMLCKFSLILLLPFFTVITITYAWMKGKKHILKYIGTALLAGIIGIIFIVWPFYQLHVINYPAERQLSDTTAVLESFPIKVLKDLSIWMSDIPGLRAINHYFLGLLMATHRTATGNTVYFLGNISKIGWWFYFPVVYFLKIPLAFHILTLLSLLLAALAVSKPFWVNTSQRIKSWIRNHFPEFSMLVFIAIYWITSISGNLNIGIRHVLPTFPFIYILVSIGIVSASKRIKKLYIFVFALLAWYIASSLCCFPYYLSYFNEIGGGYKEGYKYVVDSNYDWGQDLKRLKTWVEENNIEKIKVDYFGGGDVKYYLGDRYERLDSQSGPQKGWLAISIGQLQSGKGNPVPGFNDPARYYEWLNEYQPEARVGTSIFIYHIE